MNSRTCAVLASCMLSASAPLQADDEVKVVIYFDGGGTQTDYYDHNQTIGPYTVQNSWDHVNIWCHSGGQSIYNVGPVVLQGSINTPVYVILGSASWNGGDVSHTTACQNFGGISCTGTIINYIHFEGKAGAHLTGSVDVGHVYRFDVGGAVAAAIIERSGSSGFFACNVGSVSSVGSFYTESNITRVQVTNDCQGAIETVDAHIEDIIVGGDLLDNVSSGASINNIDVAGDIGSSTNTVSIDAVTRIDRIRASRIWADVTLDTTSTNGNFGRLETTGGATGHFDGSLTSRLLNPSGTLNFSDMVIDGDLNATLHFTEDVRAPILIDGDLASTALIDVDDDIDDNGASTDGRIVIAGECAGINAGTGVAARDYEYLIEVDLP